MILWIDQLDAQLKYADRLMLDRTNRTMRVPIELYQEFGQTA